MQHDSFIFVMEKKLPATQTLTQRCACQQKARSSEPRKKELGSSQHSDPRTQLRLTSDRAYLWPCICRSLCLSLLVHRRAFAPSALMAIDGAPSARQRRAFGATLGAGVESEAAQDIAAEHSRPSLQPRLEQWKACQRTASPRAYF